MAGGVFDCRIGGGAAAGSADPGEFSFFSAVPETPQGSLGGPRPVHLFRNNCGLPVRYSLAPIIAARRHHLQNTTPNTELFLSVLANRRHPSRLYMNELLENGPGTRLLRLLSAAISIGFPVWEF